MWAAIKQRVFTWKFLLWTVLAGIAVGVLAIIAFFIWMAALGRTVPSVEKLSEYNPPVTSRVHAGDGTLIYEFADKHRVFIPYEAIPEHVIHAFVAAEDKKFFTHGGLDYLGMTRGAINTVRNKITGSGGMQGGSTITQQVAKNMLLTRDQTITRKAKEAIVAQRMEKAFSKEHIIELYLNEIYLGGRSYGVGSAALNYFNKSLPELNLSEAAVLASLPKFPGRVNPYTNPERVLQRRNYVLNRMVDDGYITQEQADEAKARPLNTTRRLYGPEYAAATYFVQELRKQLIDQYGEEELEQGGLSIRTTIDTKLQLAAQEALQIGLETYDRRYDYRGPLQSLDLFADDVLTQLSEVTRPSGYGSWERGLVTRISESGATLLLEDGAETSIPAEDVEWAQTFIRSNGQTGLRRGDVVLAEVSRQALSVEESTSTREGSVDEEGETMVPVEPIMVPVGQAILKQVPELEGAIVALDPHTGRVLAMMGGYSFFKSPFNRVTQARRQPGSSFKPFVYGAALERGYTPSVRILDSPYVYYDENTDEIWKPENYAEGQSYGEVTMRVALEKSYNQVTARVATDIGMEAVSEFAERFGIYDRLPPYPAMSLGSGETSPWRMSKAYAALVNGGKEVTPTLLDRVQDRRGVTLFKHDQRACEACAADVWDGSKPPLLPDDRKQLVDPIIAYQLVHMLEGVVERGTGRRARRVGKPLAGKTGTTNDYVDALFFGFSPDLVVGIWTGFDTPRTLGEGEGGGSVAGVIFTEFMERALADEPALPFRIPPGVRLVSVDARTGGMPTFATEEIILEAFRPGTEPGMAFSENTNLSLSGIGDNSIFGTQTPLEPQIDPETGEFIESDVIDTDIEDEVY
ncbi:MAG: penicillin-binding protein 1A [Henriciella sp.]|nr:penicillin-binding protein 1A [Henriciella sp.]